MLKRFCWDETRLEWKTAHHRGQMDDRTRDRDHNSITANKMWPSSAVWHAFANVCVCVCLIGSAWTHLAPWRWHQSTEENWRGWRESGDQAELPSRSVCPWWPARAYTHMHARTHTHTRTKTKESAGESWNSSAARQVLITRTVAILCINPSSPVGILIASLPVLLSSTQTYSNCNAKNVTSGTR